MMYISFVNTSVMYNETILSLQLVTNVAGPTELMCENYKCLHKIACMVA